MAEKKVTKKNSKTENLLGFLPLGVGAKHKFVPKFYSNIPKKYEVTIVLSPLNNFLKRDWLRLINLITREEVAMIRGLEFDARAYEDSDEHELREVIRKSIVGWDNFRTLDNEVIVFEKDEDGFLKEELFNLFHADIIAELTNEINVISCLNNAEKLGLG